MLRHAEKWLQKAAARGTTRDAWPSAAQNSRYAAAVVKWAKTNPEGASIASAASAASAANKLASARNVTRCACTHGWVYKLHDTRSLARQHHHHARAVRCKPKDLLSLTCVHFSESKLASHYHVPTTVPTTTTFPRPGAFLFYQFS